jgi:hypothetical protein
MIKRKRISIFPEIKRQENSFRELREEYLNNLKTDITFAGYLK